MKPFNNNLKFILLISLLLLNNNYLVGIPPIKLSVSCSKRKVTIGEKFKLSLKVSHKKDIKTVLPGISSDFGKIEIKDYDIKENKKGDIIEKEIDYILAVYDVGKFVIPEISIKYTQGNLTGEVSTSEMTIEVLSLVNDKNANPKDIKGMVTFPASWFYLIASGLIAFMLAILTIVYFSIKKPKTTVVPEKIEYPGEWARRKLNEINIEKEYQANRIKEFFIELSDILRRYTELQLKVPVLESTTLETKKILNKTKLDKKIIKSYISNLEVCDLVKFAEYKAPIDYAQKLYNFILEFIEHTDREPKENLKEDSNLKVTKK